MKNKWDCLKDESLTLTPRTKKSIKKTFAQESEEGAKRLKEYLDNPNLYTPFISNEQHS